MKRLSISKNELQQCFYVYDGPIYNARGNFREKQRREYKTLSNLIECIISDFKLNPAKKFDFYVEFLSSEEKNILKDSLNKKIKSIFFSYD